jgi:hypothetical protein
VVNDPAGGESEAKGTMAGVGRQKAPAASPQLPLGLRILSAFSEPLLSWPGGVNL